MPVGLQKGMLCRAIAAVKEASARDTCEVRGNWVERGVDGGGYGKG